MGTARMPPALSLCVTLPLPGLGLGLGQLALVAAGALDGDRADIWGSLWPCRPQFRRRFAPWVLAASRVGLSAIS